MDDAMREALWEITTQARVGRPGSSPTRSKWVTIPAHVYHKAVAVLAAAPAQPSQAPSTPVEPEAAGLNETAGSYKAQPSQAGLPDREVIARIVDPKAWVHRQRHFDQSERCEYADHAEQWRVRADDVVRPSLATADAILASIRSSVGEGEVEPTWRVAGEGSNFGPYVVIDGVEHDQVVLCYWRNQIQPKHLRLTGQAYVKDLIQLMDENGCNEVAIIPARHKERVSISRSALTAISGGPHADAS